MGSRPVRPTGDSRDWHGARTGESSVLGLARVLALIGGLSAAIIGVLFGALYTLGSLFQGQETVVAAVTFGFSMVTVTVALGLAVAWQAFQAIQGRRSRPFRPRRVWPLALLFLLAVAGGQLILSLDLLAAASFPLFHVLAASLPPLLILGLAGRVLPGVTRWREVILQVGAGALLATPLALVLETTLAAVLALMAILSVALRPGGPELLERLTQVLQTAPALDDPGAMVSLLLSPAMIAAITAFVAGAVPLIEEAIKAIGVPLVIYRRPSRAQAFLWGLGGGAGFALVEGLLNSVAGLQVWAPVIVIRLGATLLHCLTGGLMGLAWYHVSRGSWWRALGLYAGSVAIHGFWNLLSVGVAFFSADASTLALSGLTLGLMVALAATALALTVVLTGFLYAVRPAATFAGDSGPLSDQGRGPERLSGPPAMDCWPHQTHKHLPQPKTGGGDK
jgi:uncharacterized membrane protein